MKRSIPYLVAVLLTTSTLAEEPSVTFKIGFSGVSAIISGVDDDYLGSGKAKDLIECVTELLKFSSDQFGKWTEGNPGVCLEE